MKLLPAKFYTQSDTVALARNLLGKILLTKFDGKITSGMIVETEAYNGATDRACHAWNYRRTTRNEPMYKKGGIAYVYLCYGIHHLFNVVTHQAGEPHAILIRAIEPLEGIEIMRARRNFSELKYNLTSGPGALSKALGIETSHSGTDLRKGEIRIYDKGIIIAPKDIVASPRVGVAYAGTHAKFPWRFRIRHNPWCSPAK